MPTRTDFTSHSSFTLNRPNSSHVTFNFPPDHPTTTRITIPAGSTWSASPHWHERYIEFFRVVSGRVTIVRDGHASTISPDSGVQIVDKYVVHEFFRADRDTGERDECDAVVEEWTDPSDGVKQVFFRNLCGVLLDGAPVYGSKIGWQVLEMGRRWDNWDVMYGVSGRGAWLVTHAAYALVGVVSWMYGLRAWYEEYTPEDLRKVVQRNGG